MPAGRSRNPERSLEKVAARGERLLTRGEQASRWFSRWRLTIFLFGALAAFACYKAAWFHTGNAVLGTFFLTFLIVTRFHGQLKDRLRRLRLWIALKHTHLARRRRQWDRLPPCSIPAPANHPYAGDLDVVGPYSLLRVIDATMTMEGQRRLGEWFLDQHHPSPFGEWASRQTLIQEIASLTLLRDRLTLEAQCMRPERFQGERLQRLVEHSVGAPRLPLVVAGATGLCATTFVLFLTWGLGFLPGYWIFTFGSYVVLYFFMGKHLEPVFGQALDLHHELQKLHVVVQRLERHAFPSSPSLQELCRPLTSSARRPSQVLKALTRLCHGLSVKAHPLIHLGLNAVAPWDLVLTLRLDRLCRDVRPTLPIWMDRLATLDAAASMGTFARWHPEYSWPTIEHAADASPHPILAAKLLAHPLIPATQRIGNDLELSGHGHLLLITGSNMSGKSTFLRTIGVNVCLAQAGAPVCAESFRWTWARIFCCIRISDSLEAGMSYFYAEVKRLKRILDAVHAPNPIPVLYLIDEIYKGTNNRERLMGSEAFIRALRNGNGFGCITTHDLELARLERDEPGLRNVHFEESVEGGKLRFDYRLRPGPCPTTNALRIMKLEGLPTPD